MKRIRFIEGQIFGILKEHLGRSSIADLCGKHCVSDVAVYIYRRASLCKVFVDLI
jgi:hypothetical protein